MRADRFVFFVAMLFSSVSACSSNSPGSSGSALDGGSHTGSGGGGAGTGSGSGNGSGGNPGNGGNPGGGGGNPGNTAGASDGGASSCAPATTDQDCKSQGSSCLNCCSCFHQEGVQTFDVAIANCVCQSSVCQSQCSKTLCAQNPTAPQQGDTCDQCVSAALQPDAGAGCEKQVVVACNANRDCVELLQCVNGAQKGGGCQ